MPRIDHLAGALAAAAALLLTLPAQASPRCPATYVERALVSGPHRGFVVDGAKRAFHLALPEPLDGPAPLLIALHGTGASGPRFLERAGLQTFVDAGFIVVAPHAARNGTLWPVWDALRMPDDDQPNPDLAYFDALLDCLADRLPVATDRVFVAGFSAGAMFANRLLQTRSERLAGGVVASGMFELTGPGDPALHPMRVIVTWGGERDRYTGRTVTGAAIRGFPFDEQGARASRFYAAAPRVRHTRCVGDDDGHAWLNVLNPWLAATLSGDASATPPTAGVRCTDEPAPLPSTDPPPRCRAKQDEACGGFCDTVARCTLGSPATRAVLEPLLDGLGLSEQRCDACTGRCAAPAPADAPVLACFAALTPPAACPDGFAGAIPVLAHVDRCCAAHPDAPLCQRLCDGITQPHAAFLPSCPAPGATPSPPPEVDPTPPTP